MLVPAVLPVLAPDDVEKDLGLSLVCGESAITVGPLSAEIAGLELVNEFGSELEFRRIEREAAQALPVGGVEQLGLLADAAPGEITEPFVRVFLVLRGPMKERGKGMRDVQHEGSPGNIALEADSRAESGHAGLTASSPA